MPHLVNRCKITYDDTVAQLAESGLLEKLTHAELVVLLRLMVAFRDCETIGEHGPLVSLQNGELHKTPRVAQRALIGLKKRGLIKIHYSGRRRLGERTLELL